MRRVVANTKRRSASQEYEVPIKQAPFVVLCM